MSLLLLFDGEAATDPPVPRVAVLFNGPNARNIGTAFVAVNLAIGLSTAVTPMGAQATTSAPRTPGIQAAFQQQNLLTSTLAAPVVEAPVGVQQTDSAPSSIRIGDMRYARGIDPVVPDELPEGKQRTESSPPAAERFMVWDVSKNLLTLGPVPPPVGSQVTQSAPTAINVQTWQPQNGTINLPVQAADQPIGKQRTESAPPTTRIGSMLYGGRGLDPQVSVAADLPIGKQRTESAPATPRVFPWEAHNFTLELPAPPAESDIPIGRQQTSSAPSKVWRADIDQPINLLGSAFGLQPVASEQQVFLRTPVASAVYSWVAPNLVIRLETAQAEQPIGKQQTASAPVAKHVLALTDAGTNIATFPAVAPPDDLPIGKQQTDSSPPTPRIGSIAYARGVDPQAVAAPDELPIGKQQTASAPRTAGVEPWDARNVTLELPSAAPPDELPIGKQWTESIQRTAQRPQIDQPINLLGSAFGLQPFAPSQSEFMFVGRVAQVFLWIPPNVTINLPQPTALPIGKQSTAGISIKAAAVYAFQPPIIVPPPPDPLPIGRQQTDSVAQIVTAVWAQNSAQLPELIPPPVVVVPPVVEPPQGGGGHIHPWMGPPKKKYVAPDTDSAEDIQRRIREARERLEKRREALRKELEDRRVIEEIRGLLDAQDQARQGIAEFDQRLQVRSKEYEEQLKLILQDDDDIALILAWGTGIR